MADRIQNIGGNGNGYFSQAVADYAVQRRTEYEQEDGKLETVGGFSEDEPDKKKSKQCEESIMLDNGCFRTLRFMKIDSMEKGDSNLLGKPDMEDSVNGMVADEAIQRLLGKGKQAPYSLMADERGIVKYKGVEFRCDYEHNRLCLGDVSNPKNCITVGLEKGGSLVFNRDNIDDLVRAIDMFSPEDINRIMRAIAQDAKLRQLKLQIEDETSGVQVLDKPEEEADRVQALDKPEEEDGVIIDKTEEENEDITDRAEEGEGYGFKRQAEQPGF